jgi:uncharacterized protein
MTGLLLILGGIAAVLFIFVRLFRARVRRRMEGVELPAELVAAQRAALAPRTTPTTASTPAVAAPVARAVPVAAAHFLLIYDVGADFIQRRGPLRDEHLALAWKAAEAGELVLAGALEEPTEQAFLLFRGSREAALRFAAADPYVRHGLVKAFRVKQWHTVVGAQAATPLRPRL